MKNELFNLYGTQLAENHVMMIGADRPASVAESKDENV